MHLHLDFSPTRVYSFFKISLIEYNLHTTIGIKFRLQLNGLWQMHTVMRHCYSHDYCFIPSESRDTFVVSLFSLWLTRHRHGSDFKLIWNNTACRLLSHGIKAWRFIRIACYSSVPDTFIGYTTTRSSVHQVMDIELFQFWLFLTIVNPAQVFIWTYVWLSVG